MPGRVRVVPGLRVVRLARLARLVWSDLYIFGNQGYLDEQFCQVEDLQDEASPNFAEEVVSLFFKDSARLVTNIEQAMEKYPKDFNRWDAHMQQLRGSCFSIGASKMNNECTSFRNSCREENAEGRSFQKVKREHAVLRQKLESYFQVIFVIPSFISWELLITVPV
ncbi:histidine-containing phosphotransfer protein 5 [Hordeum vulgare]|nr:histidine-containing phosphotransfer protein 5 [Hordeum vulgare]